jgi:hypothetical protein
MRKKIAGIVLAGALLVGVGPFTTAAHANGDTPTDPLLCFVAAQAIFSEAMTDYFAGHLTIGELREVLVGTASFLGDCLTPSV